MKKNIILCLLSAVAAVLWVSSPVRAAGTAVNVTVPTNLTITMNADGTNTVSDFTVQNASEIPVTINQLTVTKNGNWSLAEPTAGFSTNSKTLSLAVEGKSLKEGANAISVPIAYQNSKKLKLDVKRGAFTTQIAKASAFKFAVNYTVGQRDFKVTLEENYPAGTSGPQMPDLTAKNGTSITLPSPSVSGYQFLGWKDSTGTIHNGIYTVPIGNVTLTGQWIESLPVLKTGTQFNSLIPSTATSVVFKTGTKAPSTASLIDLSEAGNGDVVGWMDGTIFFVSTQKAGQKVIANADCQEMFGNKSKLKLINVTDLDTSNVTKMNGMFRYCPHLTALDVSNFNTSNVTDMSSMFYYCSSLTTLDVSNFDTSNVTNMNNMFDYCRSLKALDMGNLDTSNVTDMNGMFHYCDVLTVLDVSNFNTSNVTDMNMMFRYCRALKALDVSNFDTSNVTNMNEMFDYCRSLTALDVSNFDTSNVTKMNKMFYYCSSLTALDVSNFNTSSVTGMNEMFYYCSSLTALDVSNFDTSNVTNMNEMFYYCSGLTALDVSNFNTSSVTGMNEMFYHCSSLTALDVSNFDTSNVTNMKGMFCYCSSLKTLNMGNFDTSNVTDMSWMFHYCLKLTGNLTFKNVADLLKVTSYSNMFLDAGRDSAGITVYPPRASAGTGDMLELMIATKGNGKVTRATGAKPTLSIQSTSRLEQTEQEYNQEEEKATRGTQDASLVSVKEPDNFQEGCKEPLSKDFELPQEKPSGDEKTEDPLPEENEP